MSQCANCGETIPALATRVLILRGPHRGEDACSESCWHRAQAKTDADRRDFIDARTSGVVRRL